MGDDPPYLTVGTEVSAKYRGAFCEAKIRKVVRVVKCKVTFKAGLGSATVSDDLIKGDLRVGSVVEAKHSDRNAFVEATINKIQDCSQYTVVFDDGDITTLRRSALCLKSGRHFNESETLDQLPLTHPEHFSNPVVGGRRGVRRRVANNDDNENESSDEEETPTKKGRKKVNKEADMGKVVCVESSDKKKSKDFWFPALIVSPSAQETVRIRIRDEYLVRSFKDGRYYTVPKKETTDFTKESTSKAEHSSSLLRSACDKAVQYLEKNELPTHWDRDVLFGHTNPSNSDDAVSESEMSDDDPREDKDRFVAQLYKFMDERQTPINRVPSVCNRDLDLYNLYKIVTSKGGYNKVTNASQWKPVTIKMGYGTMPTTSTINLIKQSYKKMLHNFEEFNRKLGCSLSSLSCRQPTTSSGKSRANRSLFRDRLGSVAPKEAKKSEDPPKVELEFGPPSPATVASEEQADNETESVISEQETKIREESLERQEEPRRSRSRLDSRSTKKDSDDSSEKAEKPPVKQKRVSKKKDSITSIESREKEREGAQTPVSASPSPAPSSTGGKRGRGKPPKKKEVEVKVEVEIKSDPDESPDHIGKSVKLSVGDKVQVYYGPKSKGNVTYKAKIIEARIRESIPEFLVHYTGWNNRYDEWITRNRIASVTGSTGGKSSTDNGDNDNDSSSSKTTPKLTPKRKGRPLGSTNKAKLAGRRPQGKDELKKKAEKSSPEGQSGSDSDGETSDSDEKQQISTPPSSVSSTGSSTPAPKIGRSKRPAEDDDASSGSSSSSVPATKALKREGDVAPNVVIKSEPSPSPPVIDLNVIRSEMKGIEKIMKGASAPTPVPAAGDSSVTSGMGSKLTSSAIAGSSGTPATNDVKLDIYEFQEDFNDTPGLKMYSPRSPDKKEDVHSAKGATPESDKLSEHPSSEEISTAPSKDSTPGSKTEASVPVIAAHIKDEPGKGIHKEAKAVKPKKEIKAGPRAGSESQESVGQKMPPKKVSTKVWNPSTIATATPITSTTIPITSVPTSIIKTVTSGGLLTSSSVQHPVSKGGLVMKTPVLQAPIQLQRQRANISSPPPPLIPSAINISPKGPTIIQPRPTTTVSPPMPSLIQRPVLTAAIPGVVSHPVVTQFQPFRASSTEVSAAPVILHTSTTVISSPVSSVITTSSVTQPSIVIRTSGEMKPVFTSKQQDLFSHIGHGQQQPPTVSVASTSNANSCMPPITVVTPSGQIIHSPHTPISVSIMDSKSTPHLQPVSTAPTGAPPAGRMSPYFGTPTKKSPMKRKTPSQMDKSLSPAASGGSSLSKIDPIHLPPKKKVKKVITKNIIDMHQDEPLKEPKVESPEKKPRKPAKKRIKQDGLMDFDRLGSNPFAKSPSKSPKKKKLDGGSPVSATKSKSGTTPPYLPPVTTTSYITTTISSGGSVVTTSSPHTIVSSSFDKIPPPLELQLSGTIRAETSTGPKIDVKLVKCSTVSGIRIPEKKYAPKMSSEASARMSASIESVSKVPQEPAASAEEKVTTMTRIYPHKPGKFEYITITASDRPESLNIVTSVPSSPVTIVSTSKPTSVIHASVSDTRIVTESENRDLTVSAYTSKHGKSSDTYSFKEDSGIKSDVKPVTIVPITREIRPEITIAKTTPTCIVSSAPSVVKTEVKQEPIVSVAPTPAISFTPLKPETQDTTKVNVVSIKVSTERSSTEGKVIEDAGPTIPVVSIKEVDISGKELEPSIIKDEEESCHSLLCEEIIPGSPPPGVDSSFFGVDDENSIVHSPGLKETTSTANADDADAPPTLEKSGGSSSKPSLGARFGDIEKSEKNRNNQPRGSKENSKGSEGKSFGVGFLDNFRAGGNKDSFSSDMFPSSAKSKQEPAARFSQNSSDRPSSSGNQNHSPLGGYDGRGSSQNLQNVIDNTPPTTPESSSLSSGSPRVDGGRVSPSNDAPSSNKSKDSSDIDSMDPKRDEANEEESSSDAGRKSKDVSPSKKLDHGRLSRTLSPPGKRKRVQRRRSPDEVIRSYASYRSRGMSSRKSNSDKDSDHGKIVPPPPPVNLTKPPISKKFNLIPDLDDGMDPEHRIQVLQLALQSIRDKYHEVRSELSSEERRLKRYKRRQKEREKEKSKQAQKTS